MAPTDSFPFEIVWAGDANGSTETGYCNVDVEDFSKLLASFGKRRGETGYNARTDFDGSDSTEIVDFSILLTLFGTKCPTLTASVSGTGSTVTLSASGFSVSLTRSRTLNATDSSSSLRDSICEKSRMSFRIASSDSADAFTVDSRSR